MEAELYAAVLGCIEGLGVRSLSRDFGDDAAQVVLALDSSAAQGLLLKEGLGKAKHIDTQWLWVQQQRRRGEITVQKVAGATNPADLMTKPLTGATMQGHLKNLGYISCAAPAPNWLRSKSCV